jgi:CheY-like chemotaxis protein
MPIMSGLEFLDEYARRTINRAPIIICSTHRRDLNGHASGVAAFISKPLDLDDLLVTIRRVAGAEPSPSAIAPNIVTNALTD